MPRKQGSSKRFGSRYGTKVRKNVDEAEKKHEGYERVAPGIWKDKDSGEVFAGGTFKPDTGASEILKKALRVETEELEAAKEAIEDEE